MAWQSTATKVLVTRGRAASPRWIGIGTKVLCKAHTLFLYEGCSCALTHHIAEGNVINWQHEVIGDIEEKGMSSVRMAGGEEIVNVCKSLSIHGVWLSAASWDHLEQIPKEELSFSWGLILEVRRPENVLSIYFFETLRPSGEERI